MAQTGAENAGTNRRTQGRRNRQGRRARSRAGEPPGAQEMLKIKEPPGMLMKTKDWRQFSLHKKHHFCLLGRHFTQKCTYFAETVGSFSLFER